MRGGRVRRALLAGVLALLLLLFLLLLVERAGGHVRSTDPLAALAIAVLVGAIFA